MDPMIEVGEVPGDGVTDDEPLRRPGNGLGGEASEDVFADLFTAYPSARPGAAGATIHGVGLTFLVRDLGRSVAFYRDMLGFLEIDGGERNAILASGDTRMVLREIKDASPVNRRLVHLNLEVGDVMTVYEDLRAKGVRFTYPPRVVNRGAKLELWAAAFRDPDGHGIAITQWRSMESA
jgi:catechol 2,3-dioxygenase-like lactoylglutathione lyase family enzyme